MIIKVWFKSSIPQISDSYVVLEGKLVLIEPLGDKLRATIDMEGFRNEVICSYLTTFS
ncbi:MAG: hypothetical protein KJ847_07035 [Firmicutes bacterium]|nr:hypothetical protein [Bacillota bacterium]